MLKKSKKNLLLGLAGTLLVTSAAGAALASCTTTTNTSDTTTDVQYNYVIDWNNQEQVNRLNIDNNGLVYSDSSKTTIIAVSPRVNLATVTIPSTVKSIIGYSKVITNNNGTKVYQPVGAFQGMESLTSITLQAGSQLQAIGGLAFANCTNLKTISGLSNTLNLIGNSAFLNCSNLESIDLSNVVKVDNYAFSGCTNLQQVNLSSAIYIGTSAFQNALVNTNSNTTSISLPLVNYIGTNAFNGASGIVSIDASNASSLRIISESSFANCTSLITFNLPTNGVLSAIGTNAFNGCTSLTTVGIKGTSGFTAPSTIGNYATSSTTSIITSGIGTNVFANTKISSISLANTTATTPVTNGSFKNMTSLTSVNLGSTITTIPYSLFEGTTSLVSLTLPASISSIANGQNNPTTSIDTDDDNNSPFYNSGLTSIDMSKITSYGIGNTTINGQTFSTTTIVPYKLFQGLTNLQTVTLKTGTTSIGDMAFDGTTSLTSIHESNVNGNGLLIPSNLTTIGFYAFRNSGITLVDFANNSTEETGATNALWYIGQGAFEGTTNLLSVDLSKAALIGSNTVPANALGASSTSTTGTGLFAIASSTFKNASALKTIKLPVTLTNIFSEAFVGNNALSEVNFSELLSLKQIDTNNFNGTQLTLVDFSNMTDTTTINSLANNFTGSNAAIFTGLPTNATIKFPSSMTMQTGLSSTSFLVTGSTTNNLIRPNIIYPNGLNLTTGTNASLVSIGSGSSSATSQNQMLQYISGSYDLADNGGQNIQQYYPGTFFGNAKLTNLTLSAANLYASSSNNFTQQATLFVHNRGSGSGEVAGYYSYNFIPFGGNASLIDLTFDKFTINSSSAIANSVTNPLLTTTNQTWAQVATIINKFAANDANEPLRWPTVTDSSNPDSTSNINADSLISITNISGDSGNSTLTITNAGKTSQAESWASTTITINNNITTVTTETFIHNGVTWTLNVNPNGSITLIGKNINIYKATNPTGVNPWQVCFYEGTNEASKITVTLKILDAVTTSSTTS